MDHRAMDRRHFLAGVGVTALCGYIAATMPALSAAAAPQRKIITVAGRRMRVVDIHAHCMVPRVAEIVRGTNIDPGNFNANQVLNPMRTPERLAAMDARGIDVAVLSINAYWWYGANRDLAARIVRTHDEGVAATCKEHPDRFVGLTSVALQHPDLAAEQLEYAVKTLGFRGASVGGHIAGEVPSTETYDPFWRKAQELQVPVFMHPNNADGLVNETIFEGRGDLGNIIGNPAETTLFLSKLIFDGTLDRFPGLKICGSHGGGYLPSYFGRTEVACDVRPNANCTSKKPAREYLRNQIMADSMVFTDEGLRHLVAEMGASQVVYGSDMPFNWPDTIDLVANASYLSPAEKEAILGGNLIRLLKL
jgi:aminocarboxymuconate-semialdehyde decarboxylase